VKSQINISILYSTRKAKVSSDVDAASGDDFVSNCSNAPTSESFLSFQTLQVSESSLLLPKINADETRLAEGCVRECDVVGFRIFPRRANLRQ